MQMYAMASGRINSLANIKPNIHPRLQHGEKFLKWTDQDPNAIGVTLQIDSNGFFLYWHDQKNEITILDMAQIRDIRTGSEAKTPKDSKTREVVSMGPGILEEKTITVVHGVDLTNIFFVNFCTNKINVAEFWCQEMSQLIRSFNPLLSNAMQSLRKIHTKILLKSNADGSIPVKLVSNFFAQNKEDHKIIEQALDMSGLPSDKNESFPNLNFGFENFLVFYSHIVKLPEIKSFFEKLCGEGKNYLNMEEFLGILNKTQRDSRLNEVLFPYATEQIALEIITKYEPNQHLVKKQQLSFDGLVRFLLSEDNLAVSPVLREDMDRPLAHYFINSSHNTYLTGHQLTGKSSAEMYRQVLLAGCRCVELDFWNGRSDEEPKICHGYTLVPEIQAREVFQAIAESAFKTSKYPLILSFENHCNPKQQAKIAEYCKQYFGSALLNEPIASHPLEKNVMLPSPRDLKGKILIKNKKKHVHNHQMKSSYSTSDSIPTVFYDTSPGAPNSSPCHDSDDTDTSDSEIEEDKLKKSCDVSPHTDSGTAEKESKAGAEISALVNYIQPVHFKGFKHAKNRMRYNEMSSMVETMAYTQLKESPLDFVDYNKFQLSRIYPKGTRMDSSNYMPQAFWNTGCQLVALNFQTLDVPMQLNLGIFQFNGSTGYKLKPDFMCRDEPGHRKFDPFTESSVDGVVSATVSIKVLSGQFLTDRHVGTYVEVEMYGLPSDTVCRHKRFRTKIVPNNGICPIYFDSGSSPFVFHQVILPHLAVIRIAAYEESGKLIGLRVLPVLNLNPGFKNLPLFNESGQPLYCPCLFLLIEVADFVPNSWSELAEALSNPIAYQSELEKREYQLSVLRDDFYNQNQESSNPSIESRPSDDINSPSKSPLIVVSHTSAGAGPNIKDTKDKTISQSADNNKILPTNVKGTISPLESITLTQDSIENIFKHKSVKEKESELVGRIDSLAKKFQKEIVKLDASKTNTEYMLSQTSNHTKNPLHKASLKIVKKISASNFENITIHQVSHNIEDRRVALQKSYEEKRVQLWKTHAINEKEIKDRYFQLIWQCAEKQIKKSHTSQLKILHNLYSQEVDQIMKRIEKESKNHQAENNTVDQISNGDITRDRRNRLIKRGVAERGHLQEIYNEKKYELEQEQLIVRKEFNERWEVAQKQLDNEYKDKMILIDSMIGSTLSGETA